MLELIQERHWRELARFRPSRARSGAWACQLSLSKSLQVRQGKQLSGSRAARTTQICHLLGVTLCKRSVRYQLLSPNLKSMPALPMLTRKLKKGSVFVESRRSDHTKDLPRLCIRGWSPRLSHNQCQGEHFSPLTTTLFGAILSLLSQARAPP